jgi:hypothetical protein
VNSSARDLTRLRHRMAVANWLMLGCAILAFAWIPAGLVLIFGDPEYRPVFLIVWQLWPLAFIPLCGFGAFWCWRSWLKRMLRELESHDST